MVAVCDLCQRFARDFGAENGATWPLLMDPGNTTWEAYAVIGLPSSYFIDSAGLLQAVAFGPLHHLLVERQRLRPIAHPLFHLGPTKD